MMSEEEQMEAALAASLGQDPIPREKTPISVPTPPLPSTLQDPLIPSPATSNPLAATPNPLAAPPVQILSTSTDAPPSLFTSIAPSDAPEPAQSPLTTRIQFRFPEGGRPLVRRFNKTDTIRDVFAFVKALRSDEGEFELVFVGRRLLAEAEESGEKSLDRTIVDAGLANGSLTVEV